MKKIGLIILCLCSFSMASFACGYQGNSCASDSECCSNCQCQIENGKKLGTCGGDSCPGA